MNRPGRFTIEGGMYNDAVFNSWRHSDEYIAAEAEYLRLIPSVEGETEDERRVRVDGSSAAFSRMLGFETEGRARVSTTHPDPLVRRLTIETAWLGGPWMLAAWDALKVIEDEAQNAWVRQREDPLASYLALSSPITIRYGTTILPFNYLLDSDGRVLGKRLMPGDLEAEIAARL